MFRWPVSSCRNRGKYCECALHSAELMTCASIRSGWRPRRKLYARSPSSGIHAFIPSSLTYLLTHSLTHSLIHSFIHSFTHSFIHSFTHSLNKVAGGNHDHKGPCLRPSCTSYTPAKHCWRLNLRPPSTAEVCLSTHCMGSSQIGTIMLGVCPM